MSYVREDATEFVTVLSALDNQEIAAALSGDTDGNEIDRDAYSYPYDCKIVVNVSGDLDNENDELVFKLEETDTSGSGYADTGDSITVTDADAAGAVSEKVTLKGKKRYIRVYLDASASTLDAATDVSVDIVLAGGSEVPQ